MVGQSVPATARMHDGKPVGSRCTGTPRASRPLVGGLGRHIRSRLRRFARSTSGNVLIMFSLAAPVLIAAVGGAIDYAALSAQKTRLQQAADAAALGSAKELYLAGADVTRIGAAAEAIARSTLGNGTNAAISTAMPPTNDEVTVTIRQDADSVLGAAFGYFDTDLQVTATARVVGGGRLCVMGLDTRGAGTVRLDKNARITAPTCSVYSNSKSTMGLQSMRNASMTAEFICSAGGKLGRKANFSPTPLTDCPVVEDPLGARKPPHAGGCDANDMTIGDGRPRRRDVVNRQVNGTVVDRSLEDTMLDLDDDSADGDWRPDDYETVKLKPGTYCGGLTVNGPYHIRLAPGIYVMDGGPLRIGGGARLTGKDVGFYFTGKGASLLFAVHSTIDLEAPRTGAMAGMLFQEDRNAPGKPKHVIESADARNLLGTIYLPRGTLEVIGNGTIADKSAYTVIVARRLTLDAGPNLVLNTDYGATQVPVPRGVGPVGGGVALTR